MMALRLCHVQMQIDGQETGGMKRRYAGIDESHKIKIMQRQQRNLGGARQEESMVILYRHGGYRVIWAVVDPARA